MTTKITREMLNNCHNLKCEFKDIEYTQQIKKYVYVIGNQSSYKLLNHPQLPDIVIKNMKGVYKNEIEKIYPIDELMEGLKEKFPDSNITLNLNKTAITIDWS